MSIAKTILYVALFFSASTGFAGDRPEIAIGLGLTNGGDTIIGATLENRRGDSINDTIKAGEEIHIWGGVLIPTLSEVDTLLALGYHLDNINADNGELSFKRFTVDLIPYFKMEQVSIGAGVTYHFKADYSETGGFAHNKLEFDDTMGFIVSGTYSIAEKGFLELRYTVVDYDASRLNGNPVREPINYDGSNLGFHIGLHL